MTQQRIRSSTSSFRPDCALNKLNIVIYFWLSMTIVRTQFINRTNNRQMDRRGTNQLAFWLTDWMNRCEFTIHITYACPLLSNVWILTLSQTNHYFYVSAVQVFWKHCGKRKNCSERATSPFPIVFSTHWNFLPFLSILELSSPNSFWSLEQSKICRLGKC